MLSTDGANLLWQTPASGWGLTGNAGTTPSTNFIGTTDNQELRFRVNNVVSFRILPDAKSPNIVGGFDGNSVTAGVSGATIGGGGAIAFSNSVTDNYGTVGGGRSNRAGDAAGTVSDNPHATVGGGCYNIASGQDSTVGGGYSNTASGVESTVGGGVDNTASRVGATVGGGEDNTASGQNSTVGGGWGNTASGISASVPGGSNNLAQGDYSFAAGRRAKANNQGCFVWGDSYNGDVPCNTNNRWVARASGGVYFYTNSALSSGVYVSAGGGSWSSVSDRNLKENFSSVDGKMILARLSEIPIATWNYKSQDPSIRHMGPVAQDFSSAFGLGDSDKHINTIDVDGVALAAIQGLYQIVKEKDEEIKELRETIREISKRLAALGLPFPTPIEK